MTAIIPALSFCRIASELHIPKIYLSILSNVLRWSVVTHLVTSGKKAAGSRIDVTRALSHVTHTSLIWRIRATACIASLPAIAREQYGL